MTGVDLAEESFRLLGIGPLIPSGRHWLDELNFVLRDWAHEDLLPQRAEIADPYAEFFLPPVYANALAFNLAVQLADRFQLPVDNIVPLSAEVGKQHIRKALREGAVFFPRAPSEEECELLALLAEAKAELTAQLEAFRMAA
jgi:hypothetical protein